MRVVCTAAHRTLTAITKVIFCKLTEKQRRMYKKYLNSNVVADVLEHGLQPFAAITTLRKVCQC